MGAPLGFRCGSEAGSCWFYFCRHVDRHMDFYCHKYNYGGGGGGVGIFFSPPYGFLVTSNMNSVSYFQLLELITLVIPFTYLVPFSGGSQIAAELASSGPMPLTLVMYDDSYILTVYLYCLVGILGSLVE